MDLKFTPAEEALRQEVAEWFDQNLPSQAERPRVGGWVGLSWSRQYGGREATLIGQVIFQ